MLGYDPDHDPNRFNPDVHYRFYLSHRENRATVVCVQDFDYRDYDQDRFIGPWAFTDEATANQELEKLMIDAAKILGVFPDFLKPHRD